MKLLPLYSHHSWGGGEGGFKGRGLISFTIVQTKNVKYFYKNNSISLVSIQEGTSVEGQLPASQQVSTVRNVVAKRYVFTPVCDSVHRGGLWQTPPDRQPPGQTPPSRADNPQRRHCRGRYASYWIHSCEMNKFGQVWRVPCDLWLTNSILGSGLMGPPPHHGQTDATENITLPLLGAVINN